MAYDTRKVFVPSNLLLPNDNMRENQDKGEDKTDSNEEDQRGREFIKLHRHRVVVSWCGLRRHCPTRQPVFDTVEPEKLRAWLDKHLDTRKLGETLDTQTRSRSTASTPCFESNFLRLHRALIYIRGEARIIVLSFSIFEVRLDLSLRPSSYSRYGVFYLHRDCGLTCQVHDASLPRPSGAKSSMLLPVCTPRHFL